VAPRLQSQSGNEGKVEYRGYACGNGTDDHGSDVEKNERGAQQRNNGNKGDGPTLDGRPRCCGELDEQPTPNEPESG
jgi:hypothetical protein